LKKRKRNWWQSPSASPAASLAALPAQLPPYGGDTVDLSVTMLALLEAKVATQANLKLVESANELASKTIDILG